jgi:hypothetical protein
MRLHCFLTSPLLLCLLCLLLLQPLQLLLVLLQGQLLLLLLLLGYMHCSAHGTLPTGKG